MSYTGFTDCCGAGIIYGFQFRLPLQYYKNGTGAVINAQTVEEYIAGMERTYQDSFKKAYRSNYYIPGTRKAFAESGPEREAQKDQWDAYVRVEVEKQMRITRESVDLEAQEEILVSGLRSAKTNRHGLAMVILNDHQHRCLNDIMLKHGGLKVAQNVPNPNHGNRPLHVYIFVLATTPDTEIGNVLAPIPAKPRRRRATAATAA